jgi:integrase
MSVNVTILQRKSDTFRLRIERRVKQPDGETKRLFSYETIKGVPEDAERRRLEILREENDRSAIVDGQHRSMSLQDYLKAWVKRRKRKQLVSDTTADWYGQMLRYVIEFEGETGEVLGSRPLDKVTAKDIEDLYDYLLNDREPPLHPSTVRHIHTRLKTAFHDALVDELIQKSPMLRVVPPRAAEGKTKTLSEEQIRQVMDASWKFPGIGQVVRFALSTGCRRSEIIALKWEDVSEDCSRVTIRRSLARIPGTSQYEEKEPKTKKSLRTIALPAEMQRELQAMKAEPGRLDFSPYVFPNKDGDRRAPHGVNNQLHSLMASIGLAEFTMHDLRHAHSTLLLRRKMPIKAVSERLGHANTTVTLNVYNHVMPQDDEALAQMLDTVMRGK